jgi:hypothetical protein
MWKGSEEKQRFVEAYELVRMVKIKIGKLDQQFVEPGDVAGFEVVPGGFELV